MDELVVTRAEAGQKLLNFLSRRVNAGPGELHRWIRSGQVRLNGGRVKAFERVKEGDAIRVPPFASLRPMDTSTGNCCSPSLHVRSDAGRELPPVVFEDADLLVLNKPAGLPVQNGSGHEDSVAARLARAWARAGFVPAPVHRLDKDTSGLLIAGKTYAALRSLSDALAGRGPQVPIKEYLGWVWGHWPGSEECELRDALAKDEEEHRMRLRSDGSGRDARCIVRCLERRNIRGRAVSLLLIRLLTGRTHQIRLQLASRAFPLVGDRIYGESSRNHQEGLKLHAFRLVLPPPWDLRLETPPPWTGPWQPTLR